MAVPVKHRLLLVHQLRMQEVAGEALILEPLEPVEQEEELMDI
jgi:hypothetical protein